MIGTVYCLVKNCETVLGMLKVLSQSRVISFRCCCILESMPMNQKYTIGFETESDTESQTLSQTLSQNQTEITQSDTEIKTQHDCEKSRIQSQIQLENKDIDDKIETIDTDLIIENMAIDNSSNNNDSTNEIAKITQIMENKVCRLYTVLFCPCVFLFYGLFFYGFV